MNHSTFEQALHVHFSESDRIGDAKADLCQCAQCQQTQQRIATFSQEVAIARLSDPTPARMDQ